MISLANSYSRQKCNVKRMKYEFAKVSTDDQKVDFQIAAEFERVDHDEALSGIIQGIESLKIISGHINDGDFDKAEIFCNQLLPTIEHSTEKSENTYRILFNLAGLFTDLGHKTSSRKANPLFPQKGRASNRAVFDFR